MRALVHLGILEIVFDNRVEAAKTLRLAELAVGDSPFSSPIYLPIVIYGYGRLGLHEDVERLATHLERVIAADQRLGVAQRVLTSLARGDDDEAFRLLESAAEDKEPYDSNVLLMHIKMNDTDDPILDQPRFIAVRERLGYTGL